MIDLLEKEYLEKGITALSRAGEQGWFSGHYGAAVMAAYYISRERIFVGELHDQLVNRVNDMMNLVPDFFQPYPLESPEPQQINRIIDGISLNLKTLRTSGHGVVLGTLALKGLRDAPHMVTPTIVNGICKILDNACQDGLNRYYGIENYDEIEVYDDEIPAYINEYDMIKTAFEECEVVYETQIIDDKRYHFVGEKEHGITHAHAIYDLLSMGYVELAHQGFENHRLQMKLNRMVPPAPKRIEKSTFTGILDLNFWSKSYKDPHSLKVPYGALSLLTKLSPDEQKNYEEYVCNILFGMK
jgi:hypothetical protein